MGVGGPSVAGISQHYVNGQLPPEPPKSRWDRCNLPPTPWLVVPILFIEMLLLVAPASFLPRIILNFFDQSYPVTSIVTGAIDSIGGMLAFLMSPTFGKWSDIHGRKSVMLILSTVGLIPVLCLSFYPYLSLWFYLAARALTKISAFGILYSCISDLAPASSRGRLYAQTTGIGMSAICLGPLLSLLLNATWIFRVSGVLALIVLVYVRFLMPETLWLGFKRIEEEEEEKRLKQIQESLNNDGRDLEVLHTNTNETTKEDVGEHSTQEGVDHDHDDDQPQQPNPSFSSVSTDDLRTSLLITSPVATRHLALNASDDESDVAPVVVTSTMSVQSSSDGSEEIPNGASSSLNPFKAIKVAFTSPHHGQLALIILFSQLSSNGIFECALLYLQYKLDFDSSDIAKLMLGMGGWSAIVMVFIMPLLLRMKDDRFVLAFSLMMDFAHQLLYMLIPDKKYFWFISFCQGFGFLAFPASNALLSHSVSDAEQGAILAMSTGIRSLTQGAAPILFNGLFSYFTWDRAFVKLPQAPFILSSTFIVIAIILTLRLPKTQAHPTLSTEAEAADKTVTSNLENELLLPIADSLSEGAIL